MAHSLPTQSTCHAKVHVRIIACSYTCIDDSIECEINYHHNFKVFKVEHTYYSGIPDVVQINEHQFMERQVIEMWLALMDHWCVQLLPI
jgi:hypothetical protein